MCFHILLKHKTFWFAGDKNSQQKHLYGVCVYMYKILVCLLCSIYATYKRIYNLCQLFLFTLVQVLFYISIHDNVFLLFQFNEEKMQPQPEKQLKHIILNVFK